MNGRVKRCCLALGLLVPLLLSAAEPKRASALPRFDDVQDASLWRMGGNPAGVRLDTVNISEACLSGDYSFGEYRSRSDAPSLWTVGASARTFKHTKNFSMAGTFSFRQFTSYNHCGSMLLSPERYPVNVYEFTPGTKTRQRYALSGVVGVDVAPGWVVGAGLAFESQNCAKLKDLRYTMYYLDFSVNPSVLYRSGRWVIGASFLYERNTQSVKPDKIGETGQEYEAFLDKGTGRGVAGLWTAGNLHLNESGIEGFPIDENALGGALQFQLRSFLLELQYRRRMGRIGEKQQIWFNYKSDEVSLNLSWNLPLSHHLRLKADFVSGRNRENILEKVSEKGVINTVCLGDNPIYAQRSLSLRPSWFWMNRNWRVDAAASASERTSLSSQMYPTLYRETLISLSAEASARYTILPRVAGAPLWDLGLGLSFARGRYRNLNEDKDALVLPLRLSDEWFQTERLLWTRPVLGVDASVRCRIPMGLWIDLSVDYRQGFGFTRLPVANPYRLTSVLSVGYTF